MPESSDRPELTLITPMYNEADHIAENIEQILAALRDLNLSWEYILINDGSTDDSLAKAKAALTGEPNSHIVHYKVNRGRGYALRQGFAKARGKFILTTESDLSWGAGIIRELYEAIHAHQSDIVIASTYLPGGGMKNVPFSRRALSSYGNVIMRWCFGNHLTMLSGMTRIYRSKAIHRLPLESNRKEIHLEIVSKAQALEMKITEIPATITWEPPKPGERGRSARGIAQFVVPHLISSFSHAAFRSFFVLSCLLLFLGGILCVFGVLNKAFLLTPPEWRLPNIITYGLIVILFGFLSALFSGISLQLTTLYRGQVQTQAHLEELQAQTSRMEKTLAAKNTDSTD